jgi:hypothetical protein
MEDQDFKIHSRQIFLHQTKKKRERMREWSLKTIIFLSRRQSTPRGNGQYKGATLCSEGISIFLEKKEREEHFIQEDKGAFWFTKGSLILSISDTEFFSSEIGSNE